MRLFILAAISLAILGGILVFSKEQNSLVIQPVKTPQPVPENTISYDDKTFAYYVWSADPMKIKLIDNFDQKLSTTKISELNKCIFGINGSFYDEQGQPLAWWKNPQKTFKDLGHNSLLNGYLALSTGNQLYLSATKIDPNEVVWGMQTGPMLMDKSQPEVLKMSTDKPARRSVAALSDDGKMFALIIYEQGSKLDGPTLEELPNVVSKINTKEGFNLVSAINLDGGTASAFISPEEDISEIVNVGSWICASK